MRWTSRNRFIFVAPAVIWVLLFTIFPLCYSLGIAFFKVEQRVEVQRVKEPVLDEQGKPVLDSQGNPRTKNAIIKNQIENWTWQGGANFSRLFSDPQVYEAVIVTAIFVLVAVPSELILGFLLAVLFNQRIVARGPLRALMVLPIFATPIAMGYSFLTLFYEAGGPLSWTHIPFLSDPTWALISVIIADVWQWTPFCFLVMLAALQGVPDELMEAARIDGAGGWAMLTKVLLPVITPTIMIVLLLRLAEALKVFDIPFSLTGGGPGVATQSYSFLAFRTGLRFFDLGYASAMCYGLLIVMMIVITFFFGRLRQAYA